MMVKKRLVEWVYCLVHGLLGDEKQSSLVMVFFFNDTATTEIYTLSLHDALPISCRALTATAMIMSRYGMISSRLISVPWPGTSVVLASADFMVASRPSIMPLSEPPLLRS